MKLPVVLGAMQLLKSFSIYTIATFINRGMGLVLAPILSAYLDKAEWGTLALLNNYILLTAILLETGSKAAVSVQYFELEGRSFSDYFSTAFVTPGVLFVGVLLLALVFNEPLAAWMQMPPIWVVLTVIMALSQMLNEQCLNIFRLRDEAQWFGLFSIALSVLNFGVSLWLVIGLDWSWEGRATGMAISYAVFAAISLVVFLRQGFFTFRFRKSYLRHALIFGIPLIPHRIGAFVVEYSDKEFIDKMVSRAELGVYDMGYKVGMGMQIMVIAFSLAFLPFLFESLKKLDWNRQLQVVRISYGFVGAMLLALGLLTLAAPYIFEFIFDPKFYEGYQYVFWVGLGYLFYGVYNIFANYIHYSGKTYIFTLLAIPNVGLNLALNYYLIQAYGAMGAAYATVISYFVTMLLTIIIAHRLYPMPWFSKEVWQFKWR
ncbi:MAG: polysaccharide biosynthesis C-terminal domain-containing protein [Bacteroidota bacterium]